MSSRPGAAAASNTVYSRRQSDNTVPAVPRGTYEASTAAIRDQISRPGIFDITPFCNHGASPVNIVGGNSVPSRIAPRSHMNRSTVITADRSPLRIHQAVTEITNDQVRQSTRPSGWMTVGNGTVIQGASDVGSLLDEDTATHSNRQYSSTTVLGGVLIQGDVQRLHFHFHDGSRTPYSVGSTRGSDLLQRTRGDVERWLNEVFSNTATQMAEAVAGERHAGYEDTDDLSHRTDRATSTAVTVVFAPQQDRQPASANQRTLKLRGSSRHGSSAAPGAPGSGPPGSGTPGSDPDGPSPLGKDARHPFKPGDLLKVTGLSRDPYSVIVVRCSSMHCYCFLVSTDRKTVPAESCILLYDASRHTSLRPVDESRARASLPVYMVPGDALHHDSRVVPRALIVLPYASTVQMRGNLKKADMRTLVHVWSTKM